jgi:HPt (histidine-containing phosphotransfer) domain-containing protein
MQNSQPSGTPPAHEASRHHELDLPAILRRLGNDRALLDELIEIYLADVEPLLDEVASAVAERDIDCLVRSAHSIKGLASHFGVNSVTHAAHKIEKQGRLGDWSDMRQLLEELEQQCRLFQQILSRFKTERGTPE